MPKKLNLKEIYLQHGVITYLLSFVPLIPGFVEFHTHTYLSILELFKQDIDSAEEAVKIVFGRRGLKVYHDYLNKNPDLIRPTQIFRLFYQDQDTASALKFMERALFDPTQRQHPHSHLVRSTLIQELPFIFHAFSSPKYHHLRSRIVHQLSLLARIEQSPPVILALIQTVKTLIQTSHSINRSIKEARFNAQINALAAKIKAELAGTASPYTASYSHLTPSTTLSPLLTPQDITALTQTLTHLTQNPHSETSTEATLALLTLTPHPHPSN